MGAYAGRSAHHTVDFGLSRVLRVGKQILNAVGERAAVAADRSRFAALAPRHLEDIGMTGAERVAALGYDEPMIDAWRVVAGHL